MTLKRPESMEEVIYYTTRDLQPEGEATVWVFKQLCPECGKELMSKPRGPNGKVKIRAKEYVCPECSHTVEKKEYEESLMACVEYTCPHCGHSGEKEVPFKRKKKKGVEALQVPCDGCKETILITKKMK